MLKWLISILAFCAGQTLRTNTEGLAGTRAFLGDYEIEVSFNGKTEIVSQTLEKGAPLLRVYL